VDYKKALEYHSVELVDISLSEVEAVFKDLDDKSIRNEQEFIFDKDELKLALKMHKTLGIIKEKYNLSGFTIRCFDLLSSLKTTSCLSLALMNGSGNPCACEGDVPSLISMHILNKLTSQTGFQANPSRIDVVNKTMVLAHCTLPLNMVDSYKLDTHFESGIGVAIKGELKEDIVTIFKLSRNLKDYYVTTGKIIRNLYESNLCRTQIELSVDENIEYFLTRPYGNHHIVVYGDHKKEIQEYMSKLK
jgi:L-fucose isomerase-like protein